MLSAVSEKAVHEVGATRVAGLERRLRTAGPGRKVLVVDDEESVRHMLQLMLRKEGYDTTCAADVDAALVALADQSFDVVITDLRMPRRSGMELVDEVRARGLDTTLVVMTAYGSRDVAIEAMKRGAYDYLSKPFEGDELVLLLRKAEERERLARENRDLRQRLAEAPGSDALPGMVGTSPAMKTLARTVRKIATFKTTVLVQGESGTGKELVARALHALSPRASAPFVALNCGAIPPSLLESELFGHRKGAFTDAARDHRGLFEEAHGGTIFLDEIADLPLGVQVKLLRVLQEGEVRRLGDEKAVPVDVRVVAASARELAEAVGAGQFREDLFYRLNVVSVKVPALRERPQDIPALVAYLVRRLNERLGLAIQGVTPSALAGLAAAPWAGNVRELENALERAMVLAEGDCLGPEAFEALPPPVEQDATSWALKDAVRGAEVAAIRRALAEAGGNRTRAAGLLGVSHRALLYKIKDYGLADEAKGGSRPSAEEPDA
ncbi:MAG: sigma-54 dependent transcriptional regulator [Myxococcales bacterium]|nr:sigma-54 dependent transcriptional regulator [Myxococcales bacterium]